MTKIVAFGASNRGTSINRQLANWAAHRVDGADVNLLDLNGFEMPIYSADREKANGIPEQARQFKAAIEEADGIVISFAEHNGSYSAAFKNIFDWMSRLGRPIWSNKKMLLMATSPGPRGGQTVLASAVNSFPYQGCEVVGQFSLPSFNQNFEAEKGITDDHLRKAFMEQLVAFKKCRRKVGN